MKDPGGIEELASNMEFTHGPLPSFPVNNRSKLQGVQKVNVPDTYVPAETQETVPHASRPAHL